MTARWRPILIAWLVVLAVTQGPYLKAALDPPPGTVFVGAFHWLDDVQNYLSFAQQAEDGHFFFVNKLFPGPQSPAFVSPELWLVGRLAALLGGRPFLAFRLLGIAAAFALLVALDRLLRAAGLPETHRLPALLLVTTGGGLGGWLFLFTPLEVLRCPDLASGLFPFMGLLTNPHWTTSLALLLWSLLAFHSGARGALLRGVVLANALALTRPYEPVLLAGMLAVGALREPELRRRVLLLAVGLLPWAVYQLWLTRLVPAFSFHLQAAYPPFLVPDFLYTLGPVLLPALLARGVRSPLGADVRFRLATWAVLASLVILIRRPGPQGQFLVAIGLPLLALGALGLSRWRPLATWTATAFYGVTAWVLVAIVLQPDPHWFMPAERWNAAVALRRLCQGPDVVFAPPDIGLLANALTRCHAYVSHEAAPDHASRMARVVSFYGAADPTSRAALLDSACVAHVVLPGPSEEHPVDWLGPDTAFWRSAVVSVGARSISIHSRAAVPCSPAGPRR